jgi:hypothetical protein
MLQSCGGGPIHSIEVGHFTVSKSGANSVAQALQTRSLQHAIELHPWLVLRDTTIEDTRAALVTHTWSDGICEPTWMLGQYEVEQ